MILLGEIIGSRLLQSGAERRRADGERVEINPIAVHFPAGVGLSKGHVSRSEGTLREELKMSQLRCVLRAWRKVIVEKGKTM